jgi:hypothetical protein
MKWMKDDCMMQSSFYFFLASIDKKTMVNMFIEWRGLAIKTNIYVTAAAVENRCRIFEKNNTSKHIIIV